MAFETHVQYALNQLIQPHLINFGKYGVFINSGTLFIA